ALTQWFERAEEQFEGLLDRFEPLDMSHLLVPLHREHEIFRRLGSPGLETLGLLDPIKGRVDLDGSDMPARPAELLFLLQPFGVELTVTPVGKYPTGHAGPEP